MEDALTARLFTRVWERLIPATRWSTRRARAWSAVFWTLSMPFMLGGEVRRVRATVGGTSVEALFIGREKRFRDLLRLALPGARVESLGDRARLRHGPALEGSTADLVAVEVHPWAQPAFARAGWHIVPESVRWKMRVADFPPSDARESLRSDLRKIAKNGYRLEVASYHDQWPEFREQMLAPLVTRRFGDWAWHPSESMLREIGRRARLLYACRDGERVGGIVVVLRGKEAWIPFLGVRDGADTHVRSGAIAALYKLTFDWAGDNGIDEIDFGRTCPFPYDGIARFKRKWGLRPAADPLSPRYAMRVSPRSELLAEAFARRPVYVLDPAEVRRRSVLGGERLAAFCGSRGTASAPLV